MVVEVTVAVLALCVVTKVVPGAVVVNVDAGYVVSYVVVCDQR